MNVTLTDQLTQFFIAACIGVALGVVYDFFKVLRLIGLDFKIAAFVEDVLFFLIATVTMFSYYMQVTDGKFRIISIIAAFLGFLVYSLTVERLIFFIIKKIYTLISNVLGFIYEKVVLFIIKKIVLKPIRSIGKFFKEKIFNFFKNLLPKKDKMLYNTKRIHKRKGGKRKNAKRKSDSSCKTIGF